MGGLLLLLFGVAYLALCVWVAKWATRRIHTPSIRFSFAIVATLVLLVLPAADGMSGYVSSRLICADEAKTEVFARVVVPADFLKRYLEKSAVETQRGELDSLAPYLRVVSKERMEE